MERWRGLQDRPPGWGRCVVAIGAFDGLHRGHQAIITAAVDRARTLGEPAVLVTFDPHPSEVLRPGSRPAMLTTVRRKAEIAGELGIDVFCVLPFTLAFSRLSPAAFAHDILVDQLHASDVVVGQDFRFGARAAGDVPLLTGFGERFGFDVHGVAIVADGSSRFSSTSIRALIAAGDVEAAAVSLGRPHRLEGIVVRGDARGRELGYPTANLETPDFAAIPADGVYAGYVIRRAPPVPRPGTDPGADAGEQALPAAISIGTNPTFAGTERRIEAYVLDFSGDLYGEHLGLDFIARLRGQLRFTELDDLIAQMGTDVRQTAELLAGRDPRGVDPAGQS